VLLLSWNFSPSLRLEQDTYVTAQGTVVNCHSEPKAKNLTL